MVETPRAGGQSTRANTNTGGAESATIRAGRQALAAWERGENTGDYSRFRALLSPDFRLFTHPSQERGYHTGRTARERIEALMSSREKKPNRLTFSNAVAAENGDMVVMMFDSQGTLAGGTRYKGYNAIMFLIDEGKVAGFREYFGDLPPEWLK